MTSSLFCALNEVFSCSQINSISAVFIALVSIVAIFYNALFMRSKIKIMLYVCACTASILTIVSNNLILTFVSLELLSLFCFYLVVDGGRAKRRLSLSYFLIHSFAGILFFIFIVMNYWENDTFNVMYKSGALSLKDGALILSFIINVAAIPFFAWYVRTYLRADPFSLILLSVITTKTSLFVFWNLIPGVSILFKIGLLTLIFGALYAILTTNIIKFLLFASISSVGFCIICFSHNELLISSEIANQIKLDLVWYNCSISFSIIGFLILYGFLSNYAFAGSSFKDAAQYFKNSGSSLHFVILGIMFAFYLASFPLTTSFVAKSNISQFFVEQKNIYYSIKASSIIFCMFAIKLIMPLMHSVEFFKLDSKGRKLTLASYTVLGLLVLINLAFLVTSKAKYGFFSFSVEFFAFVSYLLIGCVCLFLIEFIFKKIRLRYIMRSFRNFKYKVRLYFLNIVKSFLSFIQKKIEDSQIGGKKICSQICYASSISLSGIIFCALFLITTLLIKL